MTTQTEALNLAISRLEWFIDSYPHDITTSKEDFLRPFKEALANHIPDATKMVAQPEQKNLKPSNSGELEQPEQETHLFEFWWSTHMPTATQEQAWKAWVSAPRYDGAISLPEPDLISEKTDEPFGYSVEAVRKILSSAPQTQPKEPEQEPVGVTQEQRRLIGVIAEKIEDGTLFQSGIYSRKDLARFVRNMLDTQPPQRKPLDIKTIKRIATYCGEHITDEDVIEITRRVEEEHSIKE